MSENERKRPMPSRREKKKPQSRKSTPEVVYTPARPFQRN